MRFKDPKLSTVKRLFGTANHCGYPNCNEPLYRSPSDGGSEPVLNCRIAHICAASPEGPRWNPHMAEESNRAFDNLLLLCLPHAEEIDVRPDGYPVELLAAWKQAQLVSDKQGVPITDDQAAEAITESHTQISIQGHVLNFGGQGGDAPGAGGGGGAAIGSGAIGGSGGHAASRIELDGLPGDNYGAGGGGGGVITPGLREGFEPTDLEGEGFSDGTDGQPGGLTSFGSGETSVVAAGGAPGLAGNLNRSRSEALSISSLISVNHVDLRDNLVFMLGGGHQSISFVNLPDECRLALLLMIEAPNVAVGTYSMHVEALDPSAISRVRVSFPVDVTRSGRVNRIPRVVSLPVQVDAVGVWTVRVSSDLRVLAELSLAVKYY